MEVLFFCFSKFLYLLGLMPTKKLVIVPDLDLFYTKLIKSKAALVIITRLTNLATIVILWNKYVFLRKDWQVINNDV